MYQVAFSGSYFTILNKWLVDFQAKVEGLQAFDELERLRTPGGRKFDFFKLSVAKACFGASVFSMDNNIQTANRIRNKDSEARGHAVVTSIKKLQKELDGFYYSGSPGHLSLGAVLPILLNEKGVDIRKSFGKVGALDALETLLTVCAEAIERQLEDKILIPNRREHGCLLYPHPIDGKNNNNKPSAETMLMFNLVLFFREWTDKKVATWGQGFGLEMPKYGRPHYGLVASFVNATFDQEYSSETVRTRLNDFLKTNSDVCLESWPE